MGREAIWEGRCRLLRAETGRRERILWELEGMFLYLSLIAWGGRHTEEIRTLRHGWKLLKPALIV
jgi:hypothetical protein